MDIHCAFCGEPWDLDSLHDMLDVAGNYESGVVSYKVAAKRFAVQGCGAFELGASTLAKPNYCTNGVADEDAAIRAEAMQNLSEHPDDWIE